MISSSSARFAKLRNIAQDERRVLRAKPDTVRQRVTDAGFARYFGHVVEIALRIRMVQIQRGRNETFRHGEQNRADSGRSAGSLGMANHRFRRAHGNPASSLFEAI